MSAQAEAQGLLRMRELAEATGVSAGTIKHYLREGLLPEPVKTSRNMAYYPREFVDRVKLIKQLQEERFLPLKVIKEVLENGGTEQDPARLRALIELEDRVLERALGGQESRTLSEDEVKDRYALPDEALERLERLGVITPAVRNGKRQFGPDDLQIIQAVERMRASGYSEALESFGGGPPQIALHGTNHPELIGGDVSNGCVRVPNDMITQVYETVPLGTPVSIV